MILMIIAIMKTSVMAVQAALIALLLNEEDFYLYVKIILLQRCF